MAALEALTGLASVGAGIARGLKQKRMAEEEIAAEKEREASNLAQQQNQRRFAIVSALLGSDAVAPEAKNALLAAVMPDYFQQTRQIQQTIPGTQATAAPVELQGTNAKNEIGVPAIPLQNELPTADRLPYTRAMTPVALPTKPRGIVGQTEVALKSGPASTTTKTITEPMNVFQQEIKKEDKELALNTIQEVYKLYPYLSPDDRKKFVQSLGAFGKTKNLTDIYVPPSLTKDASDAEKQRLENLLTQQSIATSKSLEDLNRERMGQIGVTKPMPPAQKARIVNDMADKLNRTKPVQQFKEIRLQAYKINDIANAADDDLKRSVKQETIINSFQKVLDPLSVVRESEFARTAGLQGLVDRVISKIQNIKSGGAVTDETIRSIRSAINIIGAAAQKFANAEIDASRNRAMALELDPDQIGKTFHDFPEALENAGPETSAKSGAPKEIIHTPDGDYSDEDIDKALQKKE